MVSAYYFSGVSDHSINAKAGDQIWIHGKGTVVDDFFDSIPTLAMRIEGDFVDTSYDNFSVIGGGVSSSLNVFYVYNVPEDMEVNVELVTGDYALEESEIDYILISNDVQEVINPSQNIAFGIGFFFIAMIFIIWFFKR